VIGPDRARGGGERRRRLAGAAARAAEPPPVPGLWPGCGRSGGPRHTPI